MEAIIQSLFSLYILYSLIIDFPYKKLFDQCIFIFFSLILFIIVIFNNLIILYFLSPSSYRCQFGSIINKPNWPSEILCSDPEGDIYMINNTILNLFIYHLILFPIMIIALIFLYNSSSDQFKVRCKTLIKIAIYSPFCLLILRYFYVL